MLEKKTWQLILLLTLCYKNCSDFLKNRQLFKTKYMISQSVCKIEAYEIPLMEAFVLYLLWLLVIIHHLDSQIIGGSVKNE